MAPAELASALYSISSLSSTSMSDRRLPSIKDLNFQYQHKASTSQEPWSEREVDPSAAGVQQQQYGQQQYYQQPPPPPAATTATSQTVQTSWDSQQQQRTPHLYPLNTQATQKQQTSVARSQPWGNPSQDKQPSSAYRQPTTPQQVSTAPFPPPLYYPGSAGARQSQRIEPVPPPHSATSPYAREAVPPQQQQIYARAPSVSRTPVEYTRREQMIATPTEQPQYFARRDQQPQSTPTSTSTPRYQQVYARPASPSRTPSGEAPQPGPAVQIQQHQRPPSAQKQYVSREAQPMPPQQYYRRDPTQQTGIPPSVSPQYARPLSSASPQYASRPQPQQEIPPPYARAQYADSIQHAPPQMYARPASAEQQYIRNGPPPRQQYQYPTRGDQPPPPPPHSQQPTYNRTLITTEPQYARLPESYGRPPAPPVQYSRTPSSEAAPSPVQYSRPEPQLVHQYPPTQPPLPQRNSPVLYSPYGAPPVSQQPPQEQQSAKPPPQQQPQQQDAHPPHVYMKHPPPAPPSSVPYIPPPPPGTIAPSQTSTIPSVPPSVAYSVPPAATTYAPASSSASSTPIPPVSANDDDVEMADSGQNQNIEHDPDTLMQEIVVLCGVLYEFAGRYAQIQASLPHVTPSQTEWREMSGKAHRVVGLLSEMKVLYSTDSDKENTEKPSQKEKEGKRGVKRPWEDMVSVVPPSHPSPTPKTTSQAEHDMAIIRSKRAIPYCANNSTTNQPPVVVETIQPKEKSAEPEGGQPPEGKRKTKYKKRSRANPPGKCHSCNIRETPEWRRGPDGARTLCNACGLHYAKLLRKRIREAGGHAIPNDNMGIDMETLRASARNHAAKNGAVSGNSGNADDSGTADTVTGGGETTFQVQWAPPNQTTTR